MKRVETTALCIPAIRPSGAILSRVSANAYRIREIEKEKVSREAAALYLIILSWKRAECDKMGAQEGSR